MATKRAAPGPKAQGKRKPTAKSSSKKTSPKSRVAPSSASLSAAERKQAQKLVSIPVDLVLAPQVEAPRQPTGKDQSRKRSAGVKELTWADFDRAVHHLADAIRKTFKPEAVVGVAHGGVFVGGALSSALGCAFFPVRISRRSRDRGDEGRPKGGPKTSGEMPRELKGKRVLIVDDVASSGDTLSLATALAREAGATKVSTACLIAKPEGFAPDFAGLTTGSLVVFPWDYAPGAGDARFEEDPDKAGA
ncbi:phosphoribosyltransferase [Myxococcus llanfairpwllgwyngyllgogerychwyrndrobwllllantysiliogogogochensis]|uniref:Phosphoribosyl transferase n=1 Tax=Myxococcus llanfairpwllgwyngyllgogerychwyrndrobwllllantysiliogogogochensis TaxID=2590453 RepID=A0A540WKP2_9BACT|nr:phosphoribosyltransferase [Myxococcus llanfairpwllgwyngyllgogerychwyrndrobwllllantysiliogogogochensis]TQF09588.1 phosphoribosyl transferase [Myxococcus llanfairpwllgwyngyllgogerychwyrndrobwllllantysiliogogogochensis]